jgi:hypothetical protein
MKIYVTGTMKTYTQNHSHRKGGMINEKRKPTSRLPIQAHLQKR